MTDKQNAEKQDPAQAASRPLVTLVVLILLALVVYEVYAGVALKKVGVPGIFEVDFADKSIPAPVTPPVAPSVPEVSRDFIIGRWQVDQTFGQVSGGTVIDYQDDGTLSGFITQFVGGVGEKRPAEGRWDVKRLSKDKFRLEVDLSSGETLQGTYRILDQNHIQNIEQNYVAVRVE